MTATSTKVISGTFNVAVVDTKGVFAADASTTALSKMSYASTMRVASKLAPGRYEGKLEVRLCRDAPLACKDPVPGSPWFLPYVVTVRSSTHLTPLRALPGAGAWSTFQGSASHTGYVPASLNPGAFTRRFLTPHAFGETTSEGDQVCGISGLRDSWHWTMACISDATGKALWERDLGFESMVNAPALSAGKLFVTTTGQDRASFRIYDASNGQLLSRQALSAQWDTYLAPAVLANAAFTNSGAYGGMSRMDVNSGAITWTAKLPQADHWSPAVTADRVLAYVGGYYFELDARTGVETMKLAVDVGQSHTGESMGSAVVLESPSTVYISRVGQPPDNRGHVTRINRQTGTLAWTAPTAAQSNPVLVGDVLYVRTITGMEARATLDGRLLWTWDAGEYWRAPWDGRPVMTPLVVVGRQAFTSTSTGTVAIDLDTRKVVWTDPAVGPLSVSSNGILYISDPYGLVAVNLH